MDLFKIIAATLKDNPYDVDHNQLAGKVEDAIKEVMHRPASGSPSTTDRSSRRSLVLRIKSQTDRINNQLKNEKALVERNACLEVLVEELQETVEGLEGRNARQYAKIQNLEDDKRLLIAKKEGDNTKIISLERDVTAFAKRNEDLEEKMAKTKIANEEMCEAINRLIKERDDASDKSVSLKAAIAQLRHMNSSQSKTIKKQWEDVEELRAMNDSQSKTIEKQWEDVRQIKRDFADRSNATSGEHSKKIERLEEDLKEMVGINDSRQITIDNLRKQARNSSWSELREQVLNQASRLDVLAQDKKNLQGNVKFLDEERDILLKQRTSLQAKLKDSKAVALARDTSLSDKVDELVTLRGELKSMTTAKDSLAGQLSDALGETSRLRGELITINGLLKIERDGEMSSAKASELRNLSTYHMQRADQMATKLNKIQGMLRNP